MTDVEILRPDLPRGRFRFVLFDFDGTLSLIREGWPQVMIPMMVEELRRDRHRRGRARRSRGTSKTSSCGSTAGRRSTR